jgi:hypothetical protein
MTRTILAALLLVFSGLAPAAPPAGDISQFLQLDRLERSLKLTPDQKEQYELAVGATKRLMLGLTIAAMEGKERLAAELAKPRPDLRSLEKLHEEVMDQSRTLRREAREEWMKLYAMLDEAQVAELRDFLQRRVDHLGLLHDFLRGMPQGRPKKEAPTYYW